MALDDKGLRTKTECIEDIWLTVSLLVSFAVLILTARPVSAAITFAGTGALPVFAYRWITAVGRSRLEITDLDTRPAREFVRVLAERFRGQGYRVRRAPRRFLQAYDFLLRQHGRRIVVQVTPSGTPIGMEHVQRLLAALPRCKAEVGWIVTNAPFTAEAEALAQGGQVVLWDRFRLAGFLLETSPKAKYSVSEDVAE